MTLPLGSRLGPYEVVSPLGRGGMGEVYLARDTRLDRTVALKVLPADFAEHPGRRERFEREARTVASLNHPHICVLHDIGHADGLDFIVIEHLEGETLGARLARGRPTLDEALDVAIQVSDALASAHEMGVVHRDVKPANVMLTKAGAKLLDFGLAKGLADGFPDEGAHGSESTESLTAEGAIVGTVHYMAPEQLEGGAVDARTDVFAFGAMLHEMITGQRAFEADSRAGVMARVLTAEPVRPSHLAPGIPPALDHVVGRCLAKEPGSRWQSARDLAIELRWIAGGPGGAPRWWLARRPRIRIPVGAFAAVVAAVAIAAFGIRSAPRLAAAFGGGRALAPQPIAFDVSPPDGYTFSPSASLLAVSPDGQYLAALVWTMGVNHLWLRPLADPAGRVIEGTEGALGPFWSPDSRFVAFHAGDRLKAVGVEEGPVRTICTCGEMRAPGGSWGPDGTILIGREPSRVKQEGIIRVPAAGGSPTPVTHLDRRAGETAHGLPQFLPDGRRFLYQARGPRPGMSRIYVASLDSSERVRLIDASSQAIYVSPGYLVFRQEGVLLAQAFDVKTLKLEGEPRPIADRVGFNTFGGRTMFSVSDSGTLAFRRMAPNEVVWVDPAGRRDGERVVRGHNRDAAPSPTDDRIAVVRHDPERGHSNVWVYEPSGSRVVRLTETAEIATAPVWSPDGHFVTFASNRNGRYDIYRKRADGTGPDEVLLESDVDKYPLDWARDGRLYFTQRAPYEPAELWVLDPGDRSVAGPLGRFETVRPRVSPDGQWVAYESEETGTEEVFVRRLGSGDAGKWQVSPRGGSEPRWSADSREVFFVAPNSDLMVARVRPDSGAGLAHEAATALFRTRLVPSRRLGIIGFSQYAPGREGRRFLLTQPPVDVPEFPVTVIVNWTAKLSRSVSP